MQAPKSVFGKSKLKPLRIMVLGLAGVGKTALVVRYITKRFIGEYDPTLEKVYPHQTVVENEMILMEILDSASQSHETECLQLEANMRWAEAFVLMYSVTDKCSFDECNRLKFLINYNKRRRRLISPSPAGVDVPVVLVGNKKDQLGDRMITRLEGHKRSKDIGCVGFHEISVRESPDEVRLVFDDLYREWRNNCKTPKLKRSTSDLHHGPINLDSFKFISSAKSSTTTTTAAAATMSSNNNNNNINNVMNGISTSGAAPATFPGRLGTPWTDCLLESRQSSLDLIAGSHSPMRFRDRASTDSILHSTKKIPYEKVKRTLYDHICSPLFDRRMSISMRGSNATC